MRDPLQDGLADELGPLSGRMNSGAPCRLTRRDGTSITRLERMAAFGGGFNWSMQHIR